MAPGRLTAAKPVAPLAAAEALLVERGARATRVRIAALACLLRAREALTHHDVEKRLARGGEVDRVTLYRVLDWLTAEGLVHKVSGGDRVWRFSAAGHEHPGHAHAHFQCSECGKVVCLDAARVPAIAVPAGYRRREVEITIKGSCDACAPRG